MRVELTAIGKVRNAINTENSKKKAEEIDKDAKIFLIKENKKDEDLLLEATQMHLAIAKSL